MGNVSKQQSFGSVCRTGILLVLGGRREQNSSFLDKVFDQSNFLLFLYLYINLMIVSNFLSIDF